MRNLRCRLGRIATLVLSLASPVLADPPTIPAFLDSVVPAYMDSFHLAGVAVAVVQVGEPVVLKGYGLADVESRVPVDPHSTVFGIGSITKLFTATAAAQLIDRGELSLSDPVDHYLDGWLLPDSNRLGTITLGHLLTHTAGFEDHLIGIATRDSRSLIPLRSYLSANAPRRFAMAGDVYSYSNYGMSLAGHVVECVSETEYGHYIDANIFGPLGMGSSSVGLTADLRPATAVGYRYIPGSGLRRTRESFIQLAPAGAIYSTAADMASYMIAILQDGRFGSQVLFSPKAAQLMRQRHHSGAPAQWGVGLGFTETERRGIRWYGHDGGREGYFSFLFVSPDEGIGLFVVTNTDPLLGSPVFGLEYAFTSDFSDHLRPPEAEPRRQRSRADEEEASRLSGSYKVLRTSTTTLSRISSLLLRMTLESTQDGALRGTLPGSPDPMVFHASENGLYWSEDDKNSLSFRLGPDGVPTHMYWNHVALERVPWYEAMALHIGILGASILGLLSALALPAWWGWKRVRGRRTATDLARVRVLVGVSAALLLAFLVGMAVCVGHATEIVYGVPFVFKALLTLPLVAAAVLVAAIPETRRMYRQHLGSAYSRWHICVLLASCMGFLSFLCYWRLFGYWY